MTTTWTHTFTAVYRTYDCCLLGGPTNGRQRILLNDDVLGKVYPLSVDAWRVKAVAAAERMGA